MPPVQLSKLFLDSKFWLLAIATGLIVIHLTLEFRNNQSGLPDTLLYWFAASSLVWKKRHELHLKSGWLGTGLGLCLIAIVLLKSQVLSANVDSFLRVAPLMSAVGLGLMASGVIGLKQYWQEFLILCFMIPHSGVLSQVFNISALTAEFSVMLLWCLGFDASRQGVYVILPTGSVEVNPGCSGYGSMVQLLGLATLFLLMFPTNRFQKLWIPIVSVLLGFAINGIRVAIMAVLATSQDQAAFAYWHNDEGSLVFSLISVLLFGLLCYFSIQQEQTADAEHLTED